MSEITLLLRNAREGDTDAWNRAVHLLYDDLKRLAKSAASEGGMNATALVHDCYLRLCRNGADGIVDRTHFLSLAAVAMRQLAINHARDRVAQKRGGGHWHTTLGKADAQTRAAVQSEAERLLDIDEALNRLARTDARLVQVVECRLFAGLSEEETAAAMEVSLRTAQRLWQSAREQLRRLLDDDT